MDSSKINHNLKKEESGMNMNENNCEALLQFKRQLSDILSPYDTDAQMMKWLRARNYDLEKAAALFREFYFCRKLFEIDTIVTTYKKPEVFIKYEYNGFLGIAKDRTPIRYIAMGRGDNRGFVKSLDSLSLCTYLCYMLQLDILQAREESERIGREINDVTYIFDMEGFLIQDYLNKTVLETSLDLGRLVQDYYPEIWNNIFFVNAPTYFYRLYNLLKPILRGPLLQKVQVVSKEATPEILLKYVDEDVLPEFLGGKRRDSKGNPMCIEFLRFGGQIPEDYYLSNHVTLSLSDPSALSVVIGARSYFNYPVVVPKPGSIISIEFRTEEGNIFFKIMYRKVGQNPEICDLSLSNENLIAKDEQCEVQLSSPELQMQCHISPVDYKFKAPWSSVYIFKFDNTSSWFTSKRLIYRIKLIESDFESSDILEKKQ
ncbi:SEC14-like protein 2 [Stegodyphus dumicola]|uniref:SEC14-like protein 2 n=1 Tax=Stegodyphus dumicola TaxID=202533 RepID=UPI0015AA097C|nr:SEC14-like protein 2 [Stegodyphus dumicola]